jgi:hypothetical protein
MSQRKMDLIAKLYKNVLHAILKMEIALHRVLNTERFLQP